MRRTAPTLPAEGGTSAPSDEMTITVLVPTYRRSLDLSRCLDGLAAQQRSPDQIVVVRHEDDEETKCFLDGLDDRSAPIQVCVASGTGTVAALNAGLLACRGDIIAVTDDDAVPRRDWLARIEVHFRADGEVGAVGGRDWVTHAGITDEASARRVGQIQWFGRVVGEHHHGVGPSRQVDILKGVNMAFRREAIGGLRFDSRLHGPGAQPHNELAFCLAVRRRGWTLCYDPAVAVDHYPATRPAGDVRESLPVTRDSAYNLTVIMREHLPRWRFAMFLLWSTLVGTPTVPGLVRVPGAMVRRHRNGAAHFVAAACATIAALRRQP